MVQDYDIVIVGGGPHALAVLTSIFEPFGTISHNQFNDAMNRTKPSGGRVLPRVCVVDPEGWMTAWNRRFETLHIDWLRSPALAHPDPVDDALVRFAAEEGRMDELLTTPSITGRFHTQLRFQGQYSLPSTRLFKDFCDSLTRRHPHVLMRASVYDVQRDGDAFTVSYNGRSGTGHLQCDKVVLALGMVGPPVMPLRFQTEAVRSHVCHTDRCEETLASVKQADRVLVIGGGLTAAQAALRAARTHPSVEVVLCSRRPIQRRDFDIPLEWFDHRRHRQLRFDFYKLTNAQRKAYNAKTRGGGTVPARYMDEIELQTNLTMRVCSDIFPTDTPTTDGSIQVAFGDSEAKNFDKIIFATGHVPDCRQSPLFQSLLTTLDLPHAQGVPILNGDLEWTDDLYVTGPMASLQLGPYAANLMGARLAGQIIAANMGAHDQLEESYGVWTNIFDVLGDGDSTVSDDEEEEEEDADSFTDSSPERTMFELELEPASGKAKAVDGKVVNRAASCRPHLRQAGSTPSTSADRRR